MSSLTRAKSAARSNAIADVPDLELSITDARAEAIRHQALVARYNKAKESLDELHLPSIEAAAARIKELEAAIEAFVVRRQKTLFPKDRRSVQINGADLSLRSNGGAITTQKGHSQKTVIDALLTEPDEDKADAYLTWKASLNKDAARARWETDEDFLRSLGLDLTETDSFRIDYNLAEADPA